MYGYRGAERQGLCIAASSRFGLDEPSSHPEALRRIPPATEAGEPCRIDAGEKPIDPGSEAVSGLQAAGDSMVRRGISVFRYHCVKDISGVVAQT